MNEGANLKADKWQFVSRKEVLRHPRMHLVEDTVLLPDGNEALYLRHAPSITHSVAVVAVNEKQELLLQKEFSYPTNEILWQLPGGSMFEGETVQEAANRELAEESGLKARKCREIGFFFTYNRRSDQKQFVVLCTDLYEEKADGDPEEFIESHWLPRIKVEKMAASGELHNMNLVAALHLYFAQSKNVH